MSETWREKERQMREDAIVAAGEKLFSEKGFERTGMEDIAAAAGFTKRTLYQYYDGKQQLYYAVVLRGMRRLLSDIHAAAEDAPTGLERFRRIRRAAWRCAQQYPDTFRVMSGIAQARDAGADNAGEQQISAMSAELYIEFRGALAQGRADGSLPTADEEEDFAMFFIMVGTLARLCEVGGAYAALRGISPDAFADTVIGLTDRLLVPAGR